MFTWIKSLFGLDVPDTPVIAQEPKEEKTKAQKKTSTKKETKTQKPKGNELNQFTKKELLEIARIHDIPANASLKKSELIKRIKNG